MLAKIALFVVGVILIGGGAIGIVRDRPINLGRMNDQPNHRRNEDRIESLPSNFRDVRIRMQSRTIGFLAVGGGVFVICCVPFVRGFSFPSVHNTRTDSSPE